MLSDVHAADYDAIVFVGGYGYDMNDPESYRVAQEAAAEGKVLAAICVAPITLAKAGVLKGKRATASFPGSMLEAEGATYTGTTVERDGLIITANGPAAARLFGQTIAAALED
jgi:protease I